MNEVIIISFLTKHEDRTDKENDNAIAEYRNWLEQHGEYGRLFMWDINRVKTDDKSIKSRVTGIKMFDSEVAMLFRLMFDV